MRVASTTSTVRDICTFAILFGHSTFFVALLVFMKGASMYSFLEVKLRGFRRKTYEDKYVIRDKNLPTALTVLITAGTSVTI